MSWKKTKARGYELMSYPRKKPTIRPIKLNGSVKVVAPKPPTLRILTAQNEYWVATATYKHHVSREWVCIEATGPLKILVGKTEKGAKLELLRLGCTYSWSNPAS